MLFIKKDNIIIGKTSNSLNVQKGMYEQATDGNGITWEYTLVNQEAHIKWCKKVNSEEELGETVTIPSTLDGHSVTLIGGSDNKNIFDDGSVNHFDYTRIKSIIIPDSVTTIGSHAFEGCSSLTSIEIPESVTSIGDSAFKSCSSLTSIEIPDSVTIIGGNAFAECSSLTSIEIPSSVTEIGSSAFSGDTITIYIDNYDTITNGFSS